jgi:hypothetical protein
MSGRKAQAKRVRRTSASSPSRTRGQAHSRPLQGAAVKPLSWGDRLNILDALSIVLNDTYAHLPLKRALYGFDVVRGLEHLRRQVTTMGDVQFHRELTLLINRLRDAHTQYQGPWTVKDPVASLPFLVEAYGPDDDPTYVVSKVDSQSVRDRHFVERVTIEYWNGIPFDRAVDLHAESETGGRPDARRARALESLTSRSLWYVPPPNEKWVQLGYRDLRGKAREIRFNWTGIDPGRAPAASRSLASMTKRAINHAAEAVRRAKKYRFNHELWKAERRRAQRRKGRVDGAAEFSDFLTVRPRRTSRGTFGYMRIWSFDVDDDEAFVQAAITLLRGVSDRGLIIDLRDNPGGYIWAAERLLQIFTPNPISPTKFALRATPLTAAMAKAVFNQDDLGPWAESLQTALETGEPYSTHLPITPLELCNNLGQHYGGPVVVVVDANTYSSGDLFTAGIVDNRIGTVVCVGQATGAGGANVWESDELRPALEAAGQTFPRLPASVSFRVAIRRAVRSGDADGTLIEDAGVPGQPYAMTHDDIFYGNRDLIEHCAELLAAQPFTRLDVKRQRNTLTVTTANLDQLDFYVDGHPGGPPTVLRRDGTSRLKFPAAAQEVEVVGLSGGVVRQRRRLTLGGHR